MARIGGLVPEIGEFHPHFHAVKVTLLGLRSSPASPESQHRNGKTEIVAGPDRRELVASLPSEMHRGHGKRGRKRQLRTTSDGNFALLRSPNPLPVPHLRRDAILLQKLQWVLNVEQ